MRTKQFFISLGAALVLGACGGSDDGALPEAPAAANTVPDSALASSSAYTEFVGSMLRRFMCVSSCFVDALSLAAAACPSLRYRLRASLGSSRSRRPSPIRFRPSTASAMATPG